MSRTEIRDALKAQGIFDKSGPKRGLWETAFVMYQQETKVKLCNCPGSYNQLRKWMNS